MWTREPSRSAIDAPISTSSSLGELAGRDAAGSISAILAAGGVIRRHPFVTISAASRGRRDTS
jgi:hypothetical protein